jgi:uncharacterized protein YdiU (UPF0061 family)
LDYGPFGFCELFDLRFQPWTGGGDHFCFFNQPAAAEANFEMFCKSLRPLLDDNTEALQRLDQIRDRFAAVMQQQIEAMWTRKLGLGSYDGPLVHELLQLLIWSNVDYTIFFRRLCRLPTEVAELQDSFYLPCSDELGGEWRSWLERWRRQLPATGELASVAEAMRRVNPAITWREWLVAPAYRQAAHGDCDPIHAWQALFSSPYEELPEDLAAKVDRRRPPEFFNAGGISHYSCSS